VDVWDQVHPVFLGTVRSVLDLPRIGDQVFLTGRKAHFQVDESFGGLSPGVRELDVLTGVGGGDCGIPFRTGEVYLVDALDLFMLASAVPRERLMRTFYPGVHDRTSAAIISLREGEQIRDANIRLKQAFIPRHLTVRVTWADGRLIRNIVFVKARGTVNRSAMSETSQPDLEAGIVELSILPNEPYEVEAELICRYADDRSSAPGATLKSNKDYIGPTDNRTKLSLTIPGCPARLYPEKRSRPISSRTHS